MGRLLFTLLDGEALYQRIINTVGRSSIVAYYRKVGNTLVDVVNAYNGTLTNATEVAGLGGWMAGVFDGTAYGNIDAIKTHLNYAEGTFHTIVKVAGAAVWTDGTYGVVQRELVDANNIFTTAKDGSVGNRIYFTYSAGGTGARSPSLINVSNTGLFGWGGVWSKTSNISALLYNGARHDTRDSSGVWAGTPTISSIASNNAISASVAWKGTMDQILYLNRALTEAESSALVDLYGLGVKTYTTIGDSISANAAGYQTGVLGAYNGGNARNRNHAVSGATVITNASNKISTQVTAAANDNADMIIIHAGVNDDNAGNMTALQAEAEAQIVALKASNPRAVIYWMNVLPAWTNNTVGPALDKSNIRTAIAAACTAQGITCWDTFSTPWITQAQTADGIHPAAAGIAAIIAQIIARI